MLASTLTGLVNPPHGASRVYEVPLCGFSGLMLMRDNLRLYVDEDFNETYNASMDDGCWLDGSYHF